MVPAIAVMPVTMAIPIAAAVIIGADHQPRCDDHVAVVRTTATAGPAMIAPAAAIGSKGRRRGGKHDAGGKRGEHDLLHDDASHMTILRSGPIWDGHRTSRRPCRSSLRAGPVDPTAAARQLHRVKRETTRRATTAR